MFRWAKVPPLFTDLSMTEMKASFSKRVFSLNFLDNNILVIGTLRETERSVVTVRI